ncbi:hypothetical protein MCHI_002738 [Candidatus Magnetoovum chiemensis]|nr:hypothetical protein MCHI_002738 [Candidatus Magnetoovum chiemensis]
MKRIIITLALILISSNAYAHKVNVFAYEQEGKIFTECYFANGDMCKNSEVVVYDKQSGQTLLDGKTDDKGLFSFNKPHSQELKIVINAGLGHQGEYFLSASTEKNNSASGITIETTVKDKSQNNDNNCVNSITERQIETLMDKKLKPMLDILLTMERERHKISLSEVIPATGYILGIFGAIALIKKRRQ